MYKKLDGEIHITSAWNYKFEDGRLRMSELKFHPVRGGWQHVGISKDDSSIFDMLRPQYKER